MQIERSLAVISTELKDIEERRERLLKESREAIAQASKAIVNVHVGRMQDAIVCLRSTEEVLRRLRPLAQGDLERYLTGPEAEYVEASALIAVAKGKPIPGHDVLGVSGHAYLLGLLDAVGEFKRHTYEKIRVGDSESAVKLFNLMERLYEQLQPFASYDNLAKGVRRKLDVARSTLEDTRSAVTEDVRRSKFMEAMRNLSHQLEKASPEKPKVMKRVRSG